LPALEASITNRTKMIIVNSPNNPSGAVYPEHTLRQIAAIAEKHNLLIISDEIYEHFVYEGNHFSIGSIYPNTITMNGFSKEFAMTGWRVGYVTGPQEIISAINELQQYVVMSSSSLAQHAALAALQNRPKITDKYRKKHDFILHEFNKLGLDVHGAQGAFYAFFKAPNDMTDFDFVEKATDYNLILVPGRAFSKLHGFVRLSYGADMHTLQRGMQALERMINDLK
jgi:aspartate/methionine/tyrosine aminotransferase